MYVKFFVIHRPSARNYGLFMLLQVAFLLSLEFGFQRRKHPLEALLKVKELKLVIKKLKPRQGCDFVEVFQKPFFREIMFVQGFEFEL